MFPGIILELILCYLFFVYRVYIIEERYSRILSESLNFSIQKLNKHFLLFFFFFLIVNYHINVVERNRGSNYSSVFFPLLLTGACEQLGAYLTPHRYRYEPMSHTFPTLDMPNITNDRHQPCISPAQNYSVPVFLRMYLQ